jgi:dipeptidyl aminopeptidase/acylaminoacyl peptidase
MVEALEKAGVTTKLVIKPGAGHGWMTIVQDVGTFADWFDKYLEGKKPATAGAGQDK